MQIISCNVRLENCNLVYVTKKKIRDDHNASINRRARKHNTQDRNNINDPRKKHRLRTVSKIILLETGFTVRQPLFRLETPRRKQIDHQRKKLTYCLVIITCNPKSLQRTTTSIFIKPEEKKITQG